MATRDQVRYLEPEQFRALDQRLKKIGDELQRLNDREEALRGKVISGSAE